MPVRCAHWEQQQSVEKENYCCPLVMLRERIQAVSPTTICIRFEKRFIKCCVLALAPYEFHFANISFAAMHKSSQVGETVTPEFMDLILTWKKNCNEKKENRWYLRWYSPAVACAPHTTSLAPHETNLGESVSGPAIVKEIYVGIGWKEIWIVLCVCAREGGRGAEHSSNVITNPLHHVFVLFD